MLLFKDQEGIMDIKDVTDHLDCKDMCLLAGQPGGVLCSGFLVQGRKVKAMEESYTKPA